jgi:hypothetical protein
VNTIVAGSFTIDPGSYKAYNFTVYPGDIPMGPGGSFTVNGNVQGIKVYLMDSGSFENWAIGQPANKYLETGVTTAAGVSIDQLLPSGTYYLVFDNLFSESSKNVTATINYAHL